MPDELRFSEEEANEILRTAVRIAAPGKISREELTIVAAKLGINESELAAAEEKNDQLKTEEGERKEFHRMRVATWRMSLLSIACVFVAPPLISTILNWELEYLAIGLILMLCNAPLVALMLAMAWSRSLSKKSGSYEADFERWRYYRKLEVSPLLRMDFVDAVVGNALANGQQTTLFNLRYSVMRALGSDWKRAVDAVNEYFERRPEMKALVKGAG